MRLSVNSNIRKDGKYKVTLSFEGAPNAFGGRYPTRVYRKLMNEQAIVEYCVTYHDREAFELNAVPYSIVDKIDLIFEAKDKFDRKYPYVDFFRRD